MSTVETETKTLTLTPLTLYKKIIFIGFKEVICNSIVQCVCFGCTVVWVFTTESTVFSSDNTD